jgi:nitrogen fixation protein NifU and related proteins
MMQVPEPQLDDLYKELILDHYRSPRNRGRLATADIRSEGYNPLCGDELALELAFDDGVIADVAFEGRGCSISQASASMMTDAIKGSRIEDARHMSDAFRKMMTDADPEAPEELGDLEAFQGVAKFPVRVKCATLAWRVLDDSLSQRKNESNSGR